MKPRHEAAFMQCAEAFADLSYSTRLKVGCVIVKDASIVATGWNGMAHGADNVCEDEEGNTKPDCIHAEDNALRKLTKSTASAIGGTCFVTHATCKLCAQRLIDAGIMEVIYKYPYRNTEGLNLLSRKGIIVRQYQPVTKEAV